MTESAGLSSRGVNGYGDVTSVSPWTLVDSKEVKRVVRRALGTDWRGAAGGVCFSCMIWSVGVQGISSAPAESVSPILSFATEVLLRLMVGGVSETLEVIAGEESESIRLRSSNLGVGGRGR